MNGNHSSGQNDDRPGQQLLEITTGVRQLMENAFDPLAYAVEPVFKVIRVLVDLVATLGGPSAIDGLIENQTLPEITDKAFVANDLASAQNPLYGANIPSDPA